MFSCASVFEWCAITGDSQVKRHTIGRQRRYRQHAEHHNQNQQKSNESLFHSSDLLLFIVCFVLWKRIYVENGCAIGFFRCFAPGGGSFVRRVAYVPTFLYHTTFALRTQGVLHAEGGKIWGAPVLWLPLGARGAGAERLRGFECYKFRNCPVIRCVRIPSVSVADSSPYA